ncbi:amidohydrolase family protein [Nocardioides sp. Kera G14]|uniref:amidohydrolase family protein n=1 Tax=Nocardioides sp. Kera G14 TaxID=2884264 RepID=UPI001D121526|nr:amidohydrolase family protein [Nocardioides sp. Kera G14]UDY24784.1 amidohydrolase [Nocardioides sp. Kera G14]
MSHHEEAGEVRAVIERLGLPGLIDVHTHFMPDNVLAKVWDYFDAVGPMTGMEWPITYRFAEEQRIGLLRDFGVLRFTSMIYAHRPDMAAWLNAWARDFAARTPEVLQTATFYPEPSVEQYVDLALGSGTRIFKIHIQVGDFAPDDPALDATWGMVSDAQVPVLIHCGSGPAPGRFTGPDRMRTLMRRHPRLRLVIAHMGLPEYADFLDLADRYEGVHLDTTMVFTDFTEALAPFPPELRPRLDELGERILFGSDFPNIPYPYLHAVEAVERLELGDAWLRGVLHDNAARLFA